MENLLNKLNHFKTCSKCGQHKALNEFLSGHDENKKAIYSDICYSCRSEQSTEDDNTRHGKKYTLALDSETLQQLRELQEEQLAEKQQETKEYLEEQDSKAKDKEAEKKPELSEPSESEKTWQKSKIDSKQLAKSVLAAHMFNEKVNTEAIQNSQSQQQAQQIQEQISQVNNTINENEKARPVSADGMRHAAKHKHMLHSDRLDVKMEQKRDTVTLGKSTGSMFNSNTKSNEQQNNTPTTPAIKAGAR